jgi:hypothetical protein
VRRSAQHRRLPDGFHVRFVVLGGNSEPGIPTHVGVSGRQPGRSTPRLVPARGAYSQVSVMAFVTGGMAFR